MLKKWIDYWIIIRSSLFDPYYYLLNYPDVRIADIDPLTHFIDHGWREGKNPSSMFNTKYYLETNPDVKQTEVNPFVHYIRHGKKEGRTSQLDQRSLQSSEFQVSSGIIPITQNKKLNEIAVVLHLFYDDLFEEIKSYLQNINHFDLYVSIPQSNSKLRDRIFASFPEARIFYTENRGRDILPFFYIYRNISSLNYKYLLKIHTKKSPHREDGGIWRTDIYGKLLGSPEIIRSAIFALENNNSIGVIGPKGHVIDYRVYWGDNKKKTEELARRVGIRFGENHSFNFVAGSMFWAKPEALRYLSLLPIEPQEFEPEPLGPDGALVHALERFIGLIVQYDGYSIYEIDDQGIIIDSNTNSPSAFYPYGEADGTQISDERIAPQPQYSYKSGINPDTQKVDNINSLAISEKIELTENLAEKLLKCLANKQYVISISHTDYTRMVGGVEIKIMDEQRDHNKNGVTYLHIFPLKPNLRLISENEPFYIGINCDGERIGVTDRIGLLSALNQIDVEHLLDIVIHHTMGFDLELINRILKDIGAQKGRFWLHDNFSICPGYTLLRNNLIYCGAPNVNSNACLICIHGKTRRIQQAAFSKLFNDNDLEIVAPSKFTLDLWKEKSSLPSKSGKIIPHLNLEWKKSELTRPVNNPLRIGFIGYPVYWKGWETWLRLVNKFFENVQYQFFCFTSLPKTSDKMKWVNVSVSMDNRFAMVEALKDNKIDVAFLWSLCPETFSFTLYESLAAGCFAVTNKDSGNIQSYLKQNTKRGLVLENEESLFKLFSGNDLDTLVKDYQKNGIPRGELSYFSGGE